MVCTSKPSASNSKCILLWEGQDGFILRSLLYWKKLMAMCVWKEKYFMLPYLWPNVERENNKFWKICVISMEQELCNPPRSLRIKPKVCVGILQAPLTSLRFCFYVIMYYLGQCPFSIPMLGSYSVINCNFLKNSRNSDDLSRNQGMGIRKKTALGGTSNVWTMTSEI